MKPRTAAVIAPPAALEALDVAQLADASPQAFTPRMALARAMTGTSLDAAIAGKVQAMATNSGSRYRVGMATLPKDRAFLTP